MLRKAVPSVSDSLREELTPQVQTTPVLGDLGRVSSRNCNVACRITCCQSLFSTTLCTSWKTSNRSARFHLSSKDHKPRDCNLLTYGNVLKSGSILMRRCWMDGWIIPCPFYSTVTRLMYKTREEGIWKWGIAKKGSSRYGSYYWPCNAIFTCSFAWKVRRITPPPDLKLGGSIPLIPAVSDATAHTIRLESFFRKFKVTWLPPSLACTFHFVLLCECHFWKWFSFDESGLLMLESFLRKSTFDGDFRKKLFLVRKRLYNDRVHSGLQ